MDDDSEEMGVVVSGSWAKEMLDRWARWFKGEREGCVARFTVRRRLRSAWKKASVRITAWDVSGTAKGLLPMWAGRSDVILLLDCEVGPLEEMLPNTHPLVVVAVADARRKKTLVALRREMMLRAMLYCELSRDAPASFDGKCADLVEVLVARRLFQLRNLVDVTIPRFEQTPIDGKPVTFYEVRCVFAPAANDEEPLGWSAPRRYREFEALRKDVGWSVGFPAPRKSLDSLWSRAGFQDLRYLDARRRDLEAWLRGLVSQPSVHGSKTKVLTFVDPNGHLKEILLRRRMQHPDRLQAVLGDLPPGDDNGLAGLCSSFGELGGDRPPHPPADEQQPPEQQQQQEQQRRDLQQGLARLLQHERAMVAAADATHAATARTTGDETDTAPLPSAPTTSTPSSSGSSLVDDLYTASIEHDDEASPCRRVVESR